MLTHLSERDSSELFDAESYTGILHHKVFSCPPGSVQETLATGGDLAIGTVLPAKWGGPDTSTIKTARLKLAARGPIINGFQQIHTAWLELN